MSPSQILLLRSRIISNSRFEPDTCCRLWTARLNNQGYPTMSVRLPTRATPYTLLATRVALEVFVGAPPTDKHEAAHDPECPHRHCVEFLHLRWATRTENEADKRHPSRLKIREVYPPVHSLHRELA